MEARDVGDRQFDALLERLDRIGDELEALNRRTETRDELAHITRELQLLSESLNALAYAALGQTPRVHRRAS